MNKSTNYTYNGPPKIIKKMPKKTGKSRFLIDDCVFILNSTRPMNGLKKLNTPLTAKNDALLLHLEVIKAVCRRPEIIVIGGFNIKRLVKSPLRDDFIVVENPFHEISNSAEDFRIGLNASRGNTLFFINAEFIPSYPSYKSILSSKSKSQVLLRKEISGELGIELSENNFIHHFSYTTTNKVCGVYFFCPSDCCRLKKKMMGPTFDRKKFEYEMLDGIKLFPEYDIGNSIKVI